MLLDRVGVGGMAEVFLAALRDEPDAPWVVVKRILPELASRPDVVEMFLDEKRLTSLLVHPNVVRLEDSGEVEGVHFLALEYVDGASLRQLQKARRRLGLPRDLACWVVSEACAGLGYAHSRTLTYSSQPLDLVHRDISPQNILLSKAGAVKLADFGVARAGPRLSQTSPGHVKGKYSFMSPEQLLRQPLDHRSDIFSIGAVLYETTTGAPMVRGSSPQEICDAIQLRRIVPPEQRVADYPPALGRVVMRALEPRPEDRYGSAEELRKELVALVDPERGNAEKLAELVVAAAAGQGLSGVSSDQLDLATASGAEAVARRSFSSQRSGSGRGEARSVRPATGATATGPQPLPTRAEAKAWQAPEEEEAALPTVDAFDDLTVPERNPAGADAPVARRMDWRRPVIWLVVAGGVILVAVLVAGRFLL
ncbi:MAG: serine/threonine protein kinase [Deltaproteobacteria bacterium]|nr:serine/threonine protein kinase [Deltaproteobacteria bacterium]